MAAGVAAEVSLACAKEQLAESLEWFQEALGFRLEQIFPADSPRVGVISGHGLRVRLEPPSEGVGAGRLRLVCHFT
eukprot:COSAG03_NODE_15861_length_418_cov_0.971787_1_plen_76_part_00